MPMLAQNKSAFHLALFLRGVYSKPTVAQEHDRISSPAARIWGSQAFGGKGNAFFILSNVSPGVDFIMLSYTSRKIQWVLQTDNSTCNFRDSKLNTSRIIPTTQGGPKTFFHYPILLWFKSRHVKGSMIRKSVRQRAVHCRAYNSNRRWLSEVQNFHRQCALFLRNEHGGLRKFTKHHIKLRILSRINSKYSWQRHLWAVISEDETWWLMESCTPE